MNTDETRTRAPEPDTPRADACDVIRDLLPLYADEACSPGSRRAVEAHIKDCPECRGLLARLMDGRIEENLKAEKTDVIRYGEKRFRRRSATVGSILAGVFSIPILVCLIVNIASGAGMGWFFIVLASLAVAASLVITPLIMPEDKLFWTFCAFCVTLIALLAVICLVTGGDWFWIASGAALFGLGVVFLPFVIRAKPVRRLIGGASRLLIVLGLDAALFVNMMNMIALHNAFTGKNLMLILGVLAGIGLVAFEVMRNGGKES